MTDKQKEICKKYSAKDKQGYVHCYECPLRLDIYALMCRANSYYDRHKRAWVFGKEKDNDQKI